MVRRGNVGSVDLVVPFQLHGEGLGADPLGRVPPPARPVPLSERFPAIPKLPQPHPDLETSHPLIHLQGGRELVLATAQRGDPLLTAHLRQKRLHAELSALLREHQRRFWRLEWQAWEREVARQAARRNELFASHAAASRQRHLQARALAEKATVWSAAQRQLRLQMADASTALQRRLFLEAVAHNLISDPKEVVLSGLNRHAVLAALSYDPGGAGPLLRAHAIVARSQLKAADDQLMERHGGGSYPSELATLFCIKWHRPTFEGHLRRDIREQAESCRAELREPDNWERVAAARMQRGEQTAAIDSRIAAFWRLWAETHRVFPLPLSLARPRSELTRPGVGHHPAVFGHAFQLFRPWEDEASDAAAASAAAVSHLLRPEQARAVSAPQPLGRYLVARIQRSGSGPAAEPLPSAACVSRESAQLPPAAADSSSAAGAHHWAEPAALLVAPGLQPRPYSSAKEE